MGLGNHGLGNDGLGDNAQVVVRRLRRALEDLGIRPQAVAGGNWVGLAAAADNDDDNDADDEGKGDGSNNGCITFQSVGVSDAARLANLLEDLAAVGPHARQYFPKSDYASEPDEYLAQRDVFTPVAAPLDPPYPASQHHPRVRS